jgi:DoxX-like family
VQLPPAADNNIVSAACQIFFIAFVEARLPRSSIGQSTPMEQAMSTIAATAPLGTPARRDFKTMALGPVLSGLVILFLLFDGLVKLVPWTVVTEMFDRIGYGSSETLARSLGALSLFCPALCALPPTSIPNAILMAGYFCGVLAPHIRIEGMAVTQVLFGLCAGVMVGGGLMLRARARHRR